MNKEIKARKYNSPLLQDILDKVTSLEMYQTKTKMQLAQYIENLMIEAGLNKVEFAEKLGKHPSEITKWLSGTHNFTIETLIEIDSALGFEHKITEMVDIQPSNFQSNFGKIHPDDFRRSRDYFLFGKYLKKL